MDQKDIERLRSLEGHYRCSACRSTTPFFSERRTLALPSPHEKKTTGEIYRTRYQEDRDRILYSHFFRRLRLKSQMFPEQTADHLRTRLDHTLEVAQIARHLARQLRLNEDLVDAIGLAHDIGHAPFAHSGERALHAFLQKSRLDGFKHNWQGLRVVDKLDDAYPEHSGLNLTRAVRMGILRHTGLRYRDHQDQSSSCNMEPELQKELEPFGVDAAGAQVVCFESQVVAVADEIGQIVHDLEDALVSETIDLEHMVMGAPRWPLLALCLDAIQARYQHASETVLLNWRDLSRFSFADARQADLLVRRLRSELIFQLTSDVVLGSEPALAQWESTFLPSKSPTELDERVKAGHLDFTHLITFVTLAEPYQALKHNLQDLVVKSERVSRMDGKADYLLHRILKIYLAHPRQCHRTVLEYAHDSDPSIPRDVSHMSDADVPGLGKNEAFIRAAVDYVAGMTDRFALREYDQLYSAYPRAEL